MLLLRFDLSRYEYKLTKEYNWNVKNKASKGYEVNSALICLISCTCMYDKCQFG